MAEVKLKGNQESPDRQLSLLLTMLHQSFYSNGSQPFFD